MRIPIPSYEIGAFILWMWIGVFGVICVGYAMVRWWRRSHPSSAHEDGLPYSKGLRKRLKDRGDGLSWKAKRASRAER